MDVMDKIDSAVKENPVVIFMKGTPQLPQCGYSSRTAQALAACGEEFAHVNVLADPEVFQNLVGYIERGEVRPLVAATFPLEGMLEAQAAFMEKDHVGAIVRGLVGIEVDQPVDDRARCGAGRSVRAGRRSPSSTATP